MALESCATTRTFIIVLLVSAAASQATFVNPRGWEAAEAAHRATVEKGGCNHLNHPEEGSGLTAVANKAVKLHGTSRPFLHTLLPGLLLLFLGFFLGWKLGTAQARAICRVAAKELETVAEDAASSESMLNTRSETSKLSAANGRHVRASASPSTVVLLSPEDSGSPIKLDSSEHPTKDVCGTTLTPSSPVPSVDCHLHVDGISLSCCPSGVKYDSTTGPFLDTEHGAAAEAESSGALPAETEAAADSFVILPIDIASNLSPALAAGSHRSSSYASDGSQDSTMGSPVSALEPGTPKRLSQPSSEVMTPTASSDPSLAMQLLHSATGQHGWEAAQHSATIMSPTQSPARSSQFANVGGAAALVEAVLSGLGIDPQLLDAHQKLQLVGPVLQALQAQNQQQQHEATSRQQDEANLWRRMHTGAVYEGLALKGTKLQRTLEAEQLKDFKGSLADGLSFGLAIMLSAALWCAWSYGFLEINLGRAVWWLLCGGAAMLLTARFVTSQGWEHGGHQAPLMSLMIGLGVVCGLAGFVAIHWTGGRAWLWLYLWEAWVVTHLLAAYNMQALLSFLQGYPAQNPNSELVSWWRRPLFLHSVPWACLWLSECCHFSWQFRRSW